MKASERSVVNGDRSDSEGVKDIAQKVDGKGGGA